LGHAADIEEMRNSYVSIWKIEGKRPLGKPRHRWEDNIKMNFKELVFEGVNRAQMAEDKFQ